MYLGLDLGTSGLRAVLVDDRGAAVAEAEAQYDVQHPHPGWSEQHPSDWILACGSVMTTLRRTAPEAMAAVQGIGLSGHMHGAVALDAQGEVIRPCILWNDTRSAAQAARLDAQPDVREVSGNIVFPGFTAPKLAWMAEHEPECFARVDKVLLPKDYLVMWLTGEVVSDMSDASGSAWLDTGARGWSDRLLAASGMRREQMPRLVEGSERAGQLRAPLQADWGITGPVTVAAGGADNAVAACGVGCFAEGQGFVSLGTSGVLLAAKNSFAPDPATAVHTFCHAVPDRWYQMGVILAATDCLNWLSRRLKKTPAELAGLLGEVTGPSDVLFLPYLSGERTPHNDSDIRGAFIGVGVDTDDATLVQAVMEGVCFALRDCLEALKATGTELTSVLAIGGGTKSAFWLETLATVLDLPLDLPKAGEFGAALGAARLARVAVTGEAPDLIMTRPEIAGTVTPRADLREVYAQAYHRFTRLYPVLKDGM